MADKAPPTLEHQEPPIYYCWTYWMSNGEVREGCTPIEPQNHESWPDLNEYGWVYITIPIAIVFVLMFIVYLVCSKSGSSKNAHKKSLILEEDDDSDVEMEPVFRSKWSRVHSYPGSSAVHAVPIRKTRAEDLFTVVHIPEVGNNTSPTRKVPPQGGVTASMQPGWFPKPSAARKLQSDPWGMSVKSPSSYNDYVNDPRPKKPSPKVLEELSSSSEYFVTESAQQSEDENV